MSRYLVEVTQSEAVAAKRIEQSVRTIGSHFATHVEWHRKDGVCTGTIVIEADSCWSALGIVPPIMRSEAQVFHLEPVRTALSSERVPAARVPYAIAA
jgi:hypothetical protein